MADENVTPANGGGSELYSNNSIIIDTRMMSKSDFAENWTHNNPILLKGEIGIELDTDKWKCGDGVTVWNELEYSKEAVFTKSEKDKLSTVEMNAQENPFQLQKITIKKGVGENDDIIDPLTKYDKLRLSSINKVEIKKLDSINMPEDVVSGEPAHTIHQLQIGLSNEDVAKIDGALQRAGGTMTGNLTLANNPTDDMQAATKKYVDDLLTVADIMQYKGVVDELHPLPVVDYKTGWSYKIGVKGTYHGYPCEVGDMIIAVKDWESADVATNWQVLQTNIDGAVTNAEANVLNNTVAVFDGTTGKVIKSSGLFLGLTIPPATAVNKDSVLCIDDNGLATWRPINDIIDIATETKAGAVLSSNATNTIAVNPNNGVMSVNGITVDKLKNKDGFYLVLNGGSATDVI